jgi:DNA-binding SARP family transcriptional activator
VRRLDVRTRGLEFHFLGGFTVQWSDEPLPPIPSRTGRSLIAFLVVHHGHTHRRDALAARFWPDLPTSRARRRLSHALWQIQDAFGDVGERFLDASPDTLRIAPDAEFWLDTHEFEEMAESVRSESLAPADALHRIRLALDLYRGDFLSGTYDDWVLNEQERLDQLHLSLLARGIEAAKAQGEYEEALTYARRVTHHEPLREEAHREAMRLCVLLGRTSEALGLYERCRSVLEEELGAEPAEETTLLYERIASHRQAGTDPHPGTDARSPTGSPSSSLVGRERERMSIVESLERALAGRGGVVFVEGEAGLGKSRLATAIVEDAEWRGFSVLWGACDELGVGRPYAPIATALESALTPVRVQQLRPRIDPIWLTEAAAVIPALRRAAASDPRQRLSGLEGAQRMREAITQVVLGHSDVRPSLVVIEDLHWADEETLGLLHVIGPRLAAHRIVLLVTFRSDEARASDGTWELLRHLDQLTAPQRIELGPLDEAHVRELLRGVFGTDLAERIGPRIVDEVGGNPLFVIETLRALRDTGHLRADADDVVLEDLPLARTVQETIDARLGILTGEERHVLEVVAVHGRAPNLDTVLTAADLPALAAADAIEGLVNRGFLAEEGDSYGLHHDLVRRIVYGGLPEPARQALHERVGAALEQIRPEGVEALAWHFLAADAPAKALRYLTVAANEATEIHAYETAARHRATAIGLLDRVPTSVDTRYALLADHEAALDVLGRRDEQAEVLEQMAAIASDDPLRMVETQRRQSWVLLQTDRLHEAIDHARAAVVTARDSGEVDVEARLLTTVGTGLEWAGRWHEAVEAHEGAVAKAEGDRALMEAELALGNALRGVQRYAEAQEALERALEIATTADDRRQTVRILGALANVHGESGATDEAESNQRRAIEMARTIGFRHGEGVNLLNLATTLYHRGAIAEAMRDYDDAIRILTEIGNRRLAALARVNASSTRIEVLGDVQAARDDLEHCLALFDEIGDSGTAAQCEQLIGRADHMTGATDEARRRHESAIGRLESAPHSWLEVQFLRDLAETELEAGELDRALELLDDASETCDSLGLSDLAVGISALRGRVLVARGDVDEAIAETDRAVSQITGGVERPHLVHWAHHLALTAAGRADAEDALREAHAMLHQLLDGLSSDEKRRALTTVPTSAAVETAARDRRAEVVQVRLAGADAPTGRPLEDEDRVRIAWTVHTPDDEDAESPIERRRRRLVRLLTEASAQGAAPTVEDLADVLNVSSATVRRDLAALRSHGHDLRTRGSRAS